MKRMLALLLCLVMVLSMAGVMAACGDDTTETADKQTESKADGETTDEKEPADDEPAEGTPSESTDNASLYSVWKGELDVAALMNKVLEISNVAATAPEGFDITEWEFKNIKVDMFLQVTPSGYIFLAYDQESLLDAVAEITRQDVDNSIKAYKYAAEQEGISYEDYLLENNIDIDALEKATEESVKQSFDVIMPIHGVDESIKEGYVLAFYDFCEREKNVIKTALEDLTLEYKINGNKLSAKWTGGDKAGWIGVSNKEYIGFFYETISVEFEADSSIDSIIAEEAE